MVNETNALVKLNQDAEVQECYKQALSLLIYAKQLTIASPEDLAPATNDLTIIAKLKKALEEKRREYIKPLQDEVKAFNDAFKSLVEPIDKADRITRERILAYQKEQERIRQEQERINQMRLDAARAEMELKGELSESLGQLPVAPEVGKRTVTDMGSAGQRANWKYEITDFALLPDDYKVPDTALLTSIARKHHDSKQIPGVRFYNEPILQVRTS